jgi:agmatinase
MSDTTSSPFAPSGLASNATYAGTLGFLRRPFTRDLTGVDVAVVGIPFDLGTTNRSGARMGPRAIREQSSLVGDYPWGVWPWDFSPFERAEVVDWGDVTFSPGYPQRMIGAVEADVGRILDAGTAVLALGGDHMVTYPLLRAHAARHGTLALVHFDAHSDAWRDDDLNHGTMFFHAAEQGLVDPAASIQVGVRTPNPETHGFEIVDAAELLAADPQAVADRIRARVGDRAAYVTFDIDCLDPAYAPGTGTPVVGGPSTHTARSVLFALAGLPVVGADQVEVAPAYDPAGQITALAGATIAADLLYLLVTARTQRAAPAEPSGAA